MTDKRTNAGSGVDFDRLHQMVRRSIVLHADEAGRSTLARVPESLSDALSATTDQSVELHKSLGRFVSAEIAFWIDHGAIESNLLDADDILSTTYLKALEQQDSAPGGRGLYPWLRRIAKSEIKRSAIRKSTRSATEVSLEEPVLEWGPGWPDRTKRLRDVLHDERSKTPQQVVEDQELKRSVDRVLRRLPETWREIYLLSTVDEWSDVDIARIESLETERVRWILDASQAFLAEWVSDEGDRDASIMRERAGLSQGE
jgi:RNA polymerase sigma factor (sigma-70 family)